MRRNCPNCGERFEGRVCPKCSWDASKARVPATSQDDRFLTDEQRAARRLLDSDRKKDRKLLIFLIVLAAAACIYIFYRNGLIGGGSYKKPIDQYFSGIANRDFTSYVGAMPPLMEADYISERESLGYTEYEYLDILYSDIFELIGENPTVEVEYFGRERPSEEQIRAFESSYLAVYGETIKTDTVYGVDIIAHFSGDSGSADIEQVCYILRQGGRWYVVGCDFNYDKTQE